MDLTRKSTFLSRRVFYLPVDKIHPNPSQPRRWFDDESLAELSRSILRYGIIQPLTVRRGAQGYELIAGERRLRAAKLAGLREVPCLLARADEEDSTLLALIENLQRRDLHWYEEAVAIAKLISAYGLSQEQAAEKLGKSQSAIANKLRLLRLSSDCVTLLRENDLSERHARALLRLEDEELRYAAAREIVAKKYNVAQTEAYVEALLHESAVTPPPHQPTYVIKDVRIFLNSIRRQLGIMQRAGVDAAVEREDTDDEIRMTIRIPRSVAEVPVEQANA
ncbi:MAG: ParB/RepB/Spo0J family partition protein [Ruminococcaceae bacterium]|jgi:ParB family chromosome partitioning protein|nr:ParB/RepB/Spo0J family partition protein [Oscillospiraceae bacterium]